MFHVPSVEHRWNIPGIWNPRSSTDDVPQHIHTWCIHGVSIYGPSRGSIYAASMGQFSSCYGWSLSGISIDHHWNMEIPAILHTWNSKEHPSIIVLIWVRLFEEDRTCINQSIDQTSIAPISLAKPGSVARQPNQQQNRGNSSVTSTGHGEWRYLWGKGQIKEICIVGSFLINS